MKAATCIGVLLCLTSVMFGAFGAHAFAELLSQNQRQDTFELANRYHFYHGFALMLVGLKPDVCRPRMLVWVMVFFSLGVTVFSGSLYLLALTNIGWLGAITPVGGLLLLAGWSTYLVGLCRSR